MNVPGYIKLYRDIREHWLWQRKPFSPGQAWIDILLSANYEGTKFPLGNEIIEVERGEFVTSEIKLMERWGWSKTKVRAFLELLKNDSMIDKKTDRKKTTIKVLNYSIWQDSQTTNEPQKDQEKTTKRPQKDTNKNDKNDKNDKKNIYTPEFEKFYLEYPRPEDKHRSFTNWKTCLKIYTVEQLMEACRNYKKAKAGTEVQYLKSSANFLGKEKPFEDYINYKPKDNGQYPDLTDKY